MCVYTVPAGYTGYLKSWRASLSGAKKAADYSVRLYARSYGGVFRIQDEGGLSSTSSGFPIEYDVPEPYSERTDLVMRVETNTATITESKESVRIPVIHSPQKKLQSPKNLNAPEQVDTSQKCTSCLEY